MLPILSRKLVEISPLWADPSRKNRAEKQRLRPLFHPQNHPAKGRTPTFMSPESTFELLGTRSWCASSASFLSKSANLRDQECQPSWPRVPSFVTKSATSVALGCHPEKPQMPPVYNCFIVSSLWTCSKLVHFRPTIFWLRIFKIWEGICQNYSLWLYCSSQGSNMFWGVFRKKVAIR